jgi:hypothetical protein
VFTAEWRIDGNAEAGSTLSIGWVFEEWILSTGNSQCVVIS